MKTASHEEGPLPSPGLPGLRLWLGGDAARWSAILKATGRGRTTINNWIAGRRNVRIPELNTIIKVTGLSYEVLTSPVTAASTLSSHGANITSPAPEEGATAVQVPPHIMPLFMLIKDLPPDDVADVHAILYPVIKVCEGRRHGTTRVEAQAKPAAEAG